MVLDTDISVDDSAVKRLDVKAERAYEEGVRKITDTIEGHSLDFVPRDTDNLANTITSDFNGIGLSITGQVKATAPYAEPVHRGTGIYGPKKRAYAVVAGAGKVLPIPIGGARLGGSGLVLFRKSALIKGMKPRPFFTKAIKKTMIEGPDILRRVYKKYFGAKK
jgi:hypothetical protein